MKSVIKKLLILSLIILLQKTYCFSQTTSTETNQDSIVLITSEQLKYANLIFVEHEKLLIENDLLNEEVNSLVLKNNIAEEINTNRLLQISRYKMIKDAQEQYINDLTKELNKKSINYWKFGCISVSVGFLTYLLLK